MKAAIKTTLVITVVVGGLFALAWWLDPPFFTPVKAALQGQSDFAFAYPWALLGALPLVFLLTLALSRTKRRDVGAMVFTRGDLLFDAPRTMRNTLRPLPTILRGLGVLALCLAVARPQKAWEEMEEVEGIDIYVILDMSGSMQAIDITRSELRDLQIQGLMPMNRFEIASQVLADFVQRRQEQEWSDRIGMVIFARHAFLQFPLTIDYQTILWLLQRLRLNDIDPSQTAIGNALGQAVAGLIDSNAESRIIILITDGDERGGNISALSAAQVAADQGIQVYPILVGREGQVLVPDPRRSFVQQYQVAEYPVDPDLLIEIANVTEGRFFRAENREELETTLEEIIAAYEKTDFEDLIRRHRYDVFYPFVWAGFFLIGLELFLSYAVLRKFP